MFSDDNKSPALSIIIVGTVVVLVLYSTFKNQIKKLNNKVFFLEKINKKIFGILIFLIFF